jgi:type VI secretion system protein ImpI
VLKIRIENFDQLPDGGPLEYAVDRRGFDFGRDQHLDWTLPDRNRVVSGKHCEIRFYDNAYWLTDISTNGTFLNGSAKRLQSPYRLNDGDRLAAGDYILAVSITLPQAVLQPGPAALQDAPPPANTTVGGSLWDAPRAAPPPIDARDLAPHLPDAYRAADFLQQAAYVPPVFEAPAVRKPQPFVAPAPAQADPWGFRSDIAPQPVVPDAEPVYEAHPQRLPPVAVGPAPPAGQPDPRPAPAVAITNDNEYIRRFAAGAGIPEELLANMPAGELAQQSGQLLQLACMHIMAMLHARAEAKTLSRSGKRTMIKASDNNPLKFMPTAEEALCVMFGPKTKGYLDAKSAIDSAFADLKMHQIASLAAMQAAVTQLFDDLSPEAIAKSAEAKKSLLPGGKSKQWDTYAERWATKAGRREHGMLGAYLELFAEQYDKLSGNKS